MPEAGVDSDLLQVLLDIRQEVEDMAYDKLRSVLSDFSLVGLELDQKIQAHKLVIKENVREIVQRRLAERQIRMTEEEFWCICGKYTRPYEEINHKRPPLIEVKKVVSPIDLIIHTSNIDLSAIPKEHEKRNVSEKSIELSLITSSQRPDSLLELVPSSLMVQIDQPAADITSLISSGGEESIHESSSLPYSVVQRVEDIQELDKPLKQRKISGETKETHRSYARPPGVTDKSIKRIGDKTRIIRKGSTELQVINEIQGDEDLDYEDEIDSVGKLYSRDLGKLSSASIEKMEQEHFEYYEEEDSQEFIGNIFEDDRTKRMVSQRDVEISLYGEAFYEYFEDKQDEYAWVRDIINQLIDKQHVRVISDLLQEKYNELHGSDKTGTTFRIEKEILETSPRESSSTTSTNKFSEDDLEYLQRSFGGILQMALAEVTIKKPSSPLAYIAQYLLFSKLGENFDKSNKEAIVKIAEAQNKIEDARRRLYWQRVKMTQDGREIDKYLTLLDDNFKFNTQGKVKLRRGRRIRKDIVTICDSLLVKTPLYKLAKKIRRLYTFKKTLKYAKTLLQNLIRETTLIKYDTTIGIYNTLARFLNPILPQMREIGGTVFSSSFVSTFSKDSRDPTELAREKVLPLTLTVDGNTEVEDIFTNVDDEKLDEFRGRPSCYPCMKPDLQHPFYCKSGSKSFDNTKFDKIKDILSEGCNSITQMIYIDKDGACRMCQHIPNIIRKMSDDQNLIKVHLNEFITDKYMTIALKSMYDEHYEYMMAIKRQDLQILEDVKKIIDRALDFEFPNDLVVAKEAMFNYIGSIITNQQNKLTKFTEDEKARAVRKFKSGVKSLVDAAQSEASQLPCNCTEVIDDANSDQSWSDDEDGILDAKEQKRLNKIMRRVATTVEKLAMKERNIARIEKLLGVFITRAHRQPRINKRTLREIDEFLDTIAGIFEKKNEQIPEIPVDPLNLTMDAEDVYIGADSPCVCRYILQVSALLVSIHSRMLRRSDDLRKAERDELEIEIMKMFASLVDGLTLDKIQKQNLCSSNL